jgi:ubiquinone/menaquinone biosynthesis C-methylase UbiE
MASTAQSSRSRASQSVARSFDRVSRFYDNALLQQIAYRPNHDAVVAALKRYRPRRVLDIGCGTGILTTRIQRALMPEVVYGCDASEGMLEKARQRSDKVQWIQGSAEQLPFDDASLDAVVTTEAFHFFNQPAALREFRRVLEPGGHVVIAVVTPLLPVPTPLVGIGPARWFTRGQMRELVQDAGLEVIEQRSVRPLLGPLWPGAATVAVRP